MCFMFGGMSVERALTMHKNKARFICKTGFVLKFQKSEIDHATDHAS